MKIYTKTGDDGSTGLLGGTRLPKDHIRIEAYGTLDELNAFIGVLRDTEGTAGWHAHLVQIQEDLFTIGSHLAADPEKNKMTLPELNSGRIAELEKSMDDMDSTLPPMRNFVLPGGHPAVSACHVVRCICRRAERATIALSHTSYVGAEYVQYLNRLSDFFFVLSRKLAVDLGIEETPWLPGK
ncbi:MAG: cob(I)yrinic acid a,c-diamide adenosyltransferase [Cryomorphaceae bacterium]|nr:cob(I)yrinic acid a,c-diamide adenosyltransferase [Cryomorphaceae bacterium]